MRSKHGPHGQGYGFKDERSSVMKHPKGASKGKGFKRDDSEKNSRHMDFPNGEDNLPGNALNPSDPARSGHHKLSSHVAQDIHDGHDDGDADEGMAAPVGPRKGAKSSRGY